MSNLHDWVKGLYQDLGTCHPKLARGQVWCKSCGKSEKVDSGDCIRRGWLKCCGQTMTLDSPQERGGSHADA